MQQHFGKKALRRFSPLMYSNPMGYQQKLLQALKTHIALLTLLCSHNRPMATVDDTAVNVFWWYSEIVDEREAHVCRFDPVVNARGSLYVGGGLRNWKISASPLVFSTVSRDEVPGFLLVTKSYISDYQQRLLNASDEDSNINIFICDIFNTFNKSCKLEGNLESRHMPSRVAAGILQTWH